MILRPLLLSLFISVSSAILTDEMVVAKEIEWASTEVQSHRYGFGEAEGPDRDEVTRNLRGSLPLH